MKVFIENKANEAIKNFFDEVALTYIESKPVSAPYPYPYGFVVNTLSGDGDCLDCFVLTDRVLQTGDTIEAEPLALMEMKEDGEIDHKVIARLQGENRVLDDDAKEKIVNFIHKVFAHIADKKMEVGEFLPKEKATECIAETTKAALNRVAAG